MRHPLPRLGYLLAAVLLLATSFQVAGQRTASAHEKYTGYLMAHFTGEHADGEQIYLSHSDDGRHWNDLNDGRPILRSTVGTRGVRDPALIRSPKGDRYWIIATDLHIGSGTSWGDAANRGSTSIVVWESTDLVNWSKPRLLDVAGDIPDAGNAWAPEAIYDPATDDYVVYWTTNSTVDGLKKGRIWYARTSDFRSITTPEIYIDRPGNQGIIDTQIIEVPHSAGGWRYYRASGDGHLTIEAGDSILGDWTRLGDLSHLGLTGSDVEGPMWAKSNDRNEWALWLDQYATGRGYMPLTSLDLGSTQNFTRVDDYDLGGTHKRHGSILNLTKKEEKRTLAQWPSRPVHRLQSFNYQDRYVRHADFEVRLDADVDPAEDAQFRLVPGLADDSAGHVSFESQNYPGHYLRHSDFGFFLERDDGSSLFAEDATFRQEDGLDNASWSSFRSYNYPDRYLRHRNFQLRLEPVTDATGPADATFRLTS
ncbi:glycoside hydrolase family 43 protein [Streptomyces sp. MA15]|uniref:glycoside hydrolase family 43 protein n=1 Tax=Streptomyces sp. MA15 TaxID=3055061 RepID=UPI0025B10A65|nr:glycoside hydrolase family 43 protein [Streptomyces sp. MA15]MDN3272291.1 glycoside hydrolase family 43 protein [Streptomyces sp. MA15]